MRTRTFFLALLSAIYSTAAYGQAAAWAHLGMGARGMGGGNALASSTFDGVFALYNPALAAGSLRPEFELTSAVLPFDMRLNLVHGSVALPPKAGLAFGIMHTTISQIDARTASGYPDGTLRTSDLMAFTAFGVQVSNHARLGINFKLFRSQLHPDVDPATAAAVDAGLLIQATPKLNLSVSVHDLLGAFKWTTGPFYGDQTAAPRTDNMPVTLRFSGSYRFSEQSEASLEYQRSTLEAGRRTIALPEIPGLPLLFAEDTFTASTAEWRTGVRTRLHERVSVRGGALYRPDDSQPVTLTGGFSILLPYDAFKPSIDYALVRPAFAPGLIHVFSLRFGLRS